MTNCLSRLAQARPTVELETRVERAATDSFVWPDAAGKPFALCRFVNGNPEIELPALGRFSVTDDSNVRAFAYEENKRSALLDAYYRFGLPMLLQAHGAHMLHASAILGPTGVVAFCADSGTGKSTTAYALARRGYRAWADDALVWTADGDARTSLALPFGFRFLPDVIARFDGEAEHPTERSPTEPIDTAPLVALCVLQRPASAGRAPIERMSQAEAFRAVFPHAFTFQVSRAEANADMVRTYLDLAATLPVYRVEVSPKLDGLTEYIDDLERLVAAP